MRSNSSLAEIAATLREHHRFVVFSHARPDGDALGCTLAMALCLRAMGKEATAWNDDGVLEKFRFFPGAELLSPPPSEPKAFEIAVVLDNAVLERAGRCATAVAPGARWINIDHHISNERYGDLAYVDSTAPATGQILFELFHSAGLPLTPAIAELLFVAISTDTGSFQYPSTTARTFEIGAELIRAGAKVGELSQQLYESYPRRRLELLRELLRDVRFDGGGRIASFALSRATVERLGVLPEDNEGLIDHLRAVQGVVVAAFFEEMDGGKVRLSLRSKTPEVDVSRVCGEFGGGGHRLAAGARVAGALEEVRSRALAVLEREVAAAQLADFL